MKTTKSSLIILLFSFIAASFLLLSCCFANRQINEHELKELLTPYKNRLGQATQMILVWERRCLFSSGYYAYTLEKDHDDWKLVSGPMEAAIGKNGFTFPAKRERVTEGHRRGYFR
jgi:hypothetical protein